MTDAPADHTPYLSVVVAARNDDHGGDLRGRMQLFVSSLLAQCEHYGLPMELVIVEWNPPPDRPRLHEALQWPDTASHCQACIIEVPGQLHRRFEHSDALPLFQMIAKNVGIRRSRGQFVLATNVDILFTNELVRHLAGQTLSDDRMYRVDRLDVPADLPREASVDERLAWCAPRVLRINRREGTYNVAAGAFHRIYKPLNAAQLQQERDADAGLGQATTHSRLHTNACGDFTLMARRWWDAVRGYAQLPIYSMHLDSLLCHAAHHAGAREQVLPPPMAIYHIEHAIGSGYTPEGHAHLNARLAAGGVPQLSHAQFAAWALQMRRQREPMLFNDERWGLADEHLPQRWLLPRKREAATT